MSTPRLSRRQFLQRLGGGAAALTAAWLTAVETTTAEALSPAANTWGMLIDITRCVGCNSCALACQEANQLPSFGTIPTGLAKDVYTFVDRREGTNRAGESGLYYVKRQCMHCLDAACVSACPAAAMYRSSSGAVVYRAERCLGCRYCQVACPFGVPRFDWDNGLTPRISKCWLCFDRLQQGQVPACSAACPTGALRFGRRDELLVQAHAQIATHPDRYIDHVYGEFEVGGTSILYLSAVPFAQLGLPADLPQEAPPRATARIMATLPMVIAGVATAMTGAAIYTHRREGAAAEENRKEEA